MSNRAVGVDEEGTLRATEKELRVVLGPLVEASAEEEDLFNIPLSKSVTQKALNKFYAGKDGSESKQINDDVTGYDYLQVVQPHLNMSWLAKLPEISAPHYAAVKAKEVNVVGLGYRLVESPKTKRALSDITDEKKLAKFRKKLAQGRDEIYDYLDDLNEEDTILETLGRVWFDYEATGVGYLEIGRTTTGMIGYMGHIPSTTMRVRRKRDGYIQIISNKAVFFRNFGDTKTADPVNGDERPNEIVMIKKYSSKDSYYGTPDIVSALQAVAGNEFAARFNLDYFENKAVPRHLIILKGGANFSKQSEQKLIQFFETSVKGQHHRSIIVPIPGDRPDEKFDLEIKPIEAGIQDQSFESYVNTNTATILMAHRVPPNKVGLAAGSSVAASLDSSKTFKDQVCMPSQKMFAKKLNRVIKQITDVFILEFNELTLTDEDTQSKIDERYLRMQVEVPNEVRARRGMPGLQGGDKVVELKAQAQAEQRADAGKTRAEDSDRSAATSTTAANGRSPKGEGAAE